MPGGTALAPAEAVRRILGVVGWWSWLVAAVLVVAGNASAEDPASGADGGWLLRGSSLRVDRTLESVAVLTRPAPGVRLMLSSPVSVEAKALPASGDTPERVYIDLPHTTLGRSSTIDGAGPVVRVRAARREEGTTRVVVDLARPMRFHVRTDDRTITLEFDADETPVATEPRPSEPPTAAAAIKPMAATEPPPPATADRPPAPALLRGARFVWPALDAPSYAGDDVAPWRTQLASWARGAPPDGGPLDATSPAALYLAADLAYVASLQGDADPFDALHAYARAVRSSPDFPDAPRVRLMEGFTALQLGLFPEASAAFLTMAARDPTHPLAPWARLGDAVALRRAGRLVEARRALDRLWETARDEVRCEARLERARVERARHRTARAAQRFEQVARRCPATMRLPDALPEYVAALGDAGRVADARAVLARPHAPRPAAEEATLQLLAGDLASAAGDRHAAEAAWTRALGPAAPLAARVAARRRMIQLDAAVRDDAAVRELLALADEPAPPDERAATVVAAAEVRAGAGRLAEAQALLEQARAFGPEGVRRADRAQASLLARWIRALATTGNAADVATVYAAHATAIQALGSADDRLAVADALRRVDLPDSAIRVLATAPDDADPALDVTLAEIALDAGETGWVEWGLGRLTGRRVSPALAARVRRVEVGLALTRGDATGAASVLAADPDPALRVRVARALAAAPAGYPEALRVLAPVLDPARPVDAEVLVAAADVVAALGAWGDAIGAYGRVLAMAPAPDVRARASAGAARAEASRGDAAVAATMLAMDAGGDPLIDRAARVLGRLAEGGTHGG